jgi:hypothetical protein
LTVPELNVVIFLQLIDLEDSNDESNDEDEEDSLGPPTSSEVFPAGFLLGEVDHAPVNLAALHPPVSQIPLYWQLYMENCECLLRILHAPTTSRIVEDAQRDRNGLSKSNELLMFSLYFATITSLSPEEVLMHFGHDKQFLILRYETAVHKALVNAGFLNSQDFTVLQAFVLYLVC